MIMVMRIIAINQWINRKGNAYPLNSFDSEDELISLLTEEGFVQLPLYQ